jgi:hypothetical protein
MGSTETETQITTIQGKDFIFTATQNRLDVVPAQGDQAPISLKFDSEQGVWFAEYQGEQHKVAVQEANTLTLLLPNGQEETLTR